MTTRCQGCLACLAHFLNDLTAGPDGIVRWELFVSDPRQQGHERSHAWHGEFTAANLRAEAEKYVVPLKQYGVQASVVVDDFAPSERRLFG